MMMTFGTIAQTNFVLFHLVYAILDNLPAAIALLFGFGIRLQRPFNRLCFRRAKN